MALDVPVDPFIRRSPAIYAGRADVQEVGKVFGETSRIKLFIPVEFVGRDKSPGLKRGGVLTVVRPEVELYVIAGEIPENIVLDLEGTNVNDTLHISNVQLPAGVSPTITDRDFVIANIQAPSGLRSEDNEGGEDEAEEA
jgi:large subunit ribosomal protein L25